MRKTDVVVIGAGAAGLTTAYTAMGFGKKVVIIEENKPGGECTWSGCIPSKALINQANEVHIAQQYNPFVVDTKQVMSRVRGVIDLVYHEESVEVLSRDGIAFLQGTASFSSDHVIEVNGESIVAKNIFICTGSSPLVPPIEGLREVEYLTNESFFELDELPASIIVLGGGAIGVELAQAMNRLGVSVRLVEMANHILPREDSELSLMLQEKLEKEGVQIHTSTKATHVSQKDGSIQVTVERLQGTETISGERILVALGRVPNTSRLNLEAGGIKYDKRGIEVNDFLETSAKGVYAVGDVNGIAMFSHMANAQGILAVQNAILPIHKKMNRDDAPRCTFTSPEFATTGMLEKEARQKYGDSIHVYEYPYAQLDRAKTKRDSMGMVKLICDSKGKVIGCSILGDRAGELICEVQVIKTFGMPFSKLSKVIHPYPTYGEVLSKLGKKVAIDQLLNKPLVKLINQLRGVKK